MTRLPILLRPPGDADGAALHRLVQACPPLDENSRYCNLLQCTHFSATSVVGECGGELLCAVTGYLVPGRLDTLFIWQVAVAEKARGQGLGGQMLDQILARAECSNVTYLETSVTASNRASWSMFERFAARAGAPLVRKKIFDKFEHFSGTADTEYLARIGPLVLPATAVNEDQACATDQTRTRSHENI